MPRENARWFIGVDIGGTFTDLVLAEEGGKVFSRKVRTTPEDPVKGVVAGVTSVLADAALSGSRIERVVHGTTLATNLVLERKGSRLAFADDGGVPGHHPDSPGEWSDHRRC